MSAVIGVATNVDVAMCITDFLTGGNLCVCVYEREKERECV